MGNYHFTRYVVKSSSFSPLPPRHSGWWFFLLYHFINILLDNDLIQLLNEWLPRHSVMLQPSIRSLAFLPWFNFLAQVTWNSSQWVSIIQKTPYYVARFCRSGLRVGTFLPYSFVCVCVSLCVSLCSHVPPCLFEISVLYIFVSLPGSNSWWLKKYCNHRQIWRNRKIHPWS